MSEITRLTPEERAEIAERRHDDDDITDLLAHIGDLEDRLTTAQEWCDEWQRRANAAANANQTLGETYTAALIDLRGLREKIRAMEFERCLLAAIACGYISTARAAEILAQHPIEYRDQVYEWAKTGLKMAEEAP